MAFQVNDAVQLAKRGLLGGLLGGDDDASASSSAATGGATTNPGLLGGLQDGLSSAGAAITGGLGGVTSALGGLSPTTTTTLSSFSAATSSAASSTTQSATVASSTSTSSSSSSALTTSSSVPLSSAPLSSSSSTLLSSSTPPAVSSAASSTITAAPSIYVQTEGNGQAVTITSHVTAQAAASTSSAVPAPAGFLQNKGAVAGTFTVVGLIVLVLLFIASTWCIRRNKRNRLLEEAVDWSPQTHLGGGAGIAPDTEKGYPSDLYRTNSGSSGNSRSTAQRYPAPSTYRDQQQPPLPSQSQNMYGNAGNAYGGYYDKPVPAAPGSQYAGSQYAASIAPSQRTQRTYGQTTYGQYPAYNQPAPPPSLQPAQNPFNPNASTALVAPQFDRSHARTPSPTDSDMAYLGYVDAPGNGVQLGRKVSLTKATATTVQHADGTSTASNGIIAQSTLKIVNE
ncbi:hypothetical protein PENSPDRAFT_735098 [Peniophora sp. CONT]|nr:hypothetical protein PENSPDRAFT_735098 [Peniophora sp. CONT]